MLAQYIQEKGRSYEQYVLEYLLKVDKWFDNVWFFKNTPEHIISKTKLYESYDIYKKYRNSDIGSDLVGIKNNTIIFIQCKNYDNVISVDNLSSFYFLLHEFDLNGMVYYNGKLSERINDLSTGKVPFINLSFNNQIIDNQILKLNNTIITPRDYQTDAYNLLKNEHRSILGLPCGMGKTYTAYLIAQQYSNIIIISPTRSLASDLLSSLYNYSNKIYNPILISIDGSRDISYIKSLIKDKNIISSTYDSADVLNQILCHIDNKIIIIDEYHNLSDANLVDKNNEINKLLESNHKILYLSATPIQNTNEKYFGTQIFKYSWSKAIHESYICDFKIILPKDKNYVESFRQFLIDINSEQSNNNLINKAYFLLRAMLFEGSRKCIVYLTSIEKANQFNIIIGWIQKLLNVKVNTYQINCFTSKIKRADDIFKFKNDNDISLMLNVQILNEGIDIPECDSVFITKPRNDITNLIQRMSRSNRIFENKKECRIYLWCSEKMTMPILNYINDKTNNEIVNKIYKYTFNNESTKKYVEIEKYNIPKIQNDTSINKFLKDNSDIPHDFIDYYTSNLSNDSTVIDLDIVAKWLNMRKHDVKKTLIRTYIDKVDYTITKPKTGPKGGRPDGLILISASCFRRICMMSKTERGNEVRNYFEKIEKLLNKYKNYIIENLNKKIDVLEYNQKPIVKTGKGVIYFIKSKLLPDNIFKLGKSKNFKQRYLSHNSAHADNLEVVVVFETENIDQVESCLKSILKKHQYRKRKEIYQVDLDVLKEILQGCEELVTRTNNKVAKKKKIIKTKDIQYNYFLYLDKNEMNNGVVEI
jgi:superfamily II DNA or RNA helicase/phage anti-repressor protein